MSGRRKTDHVGTSRTDQRPSGPKEARRSGTDRSTSLPAPSVSTGKTKPLKEALRQSALRQIKREGFWAGAGIVLGWWGAFSVSCQHIGAWAPGPSDPDPWGRVPEGNGREVWMKAFFEGAEEASRDRGRPDLLAYVRGTRKRVLGDGVPGQLSVALQAAETDLEAQGLIGDLYPEPERHHQPASTYRLVRHWVEGVLQLPFAGPGPEGKTSI